MFFALRSCARSRVWPCLQGQRTGENSVRPGAAAAATVMLKTKRTAEKKLNHEVGFCYLECDIQVSPMENRTVKER